MGCASSKERVRKQGLQVFRKYDFVTCLGKGATSQVHEAIDREDGMAYAIKCVVKKEAAAVGRFKLDAKVVQLWGVLDHANICRLHATYEDPDLRYFVMERCDGKTFFERLEEDIVLEELETSRIGRQMFSAVAHLHDKGICHRDLKPESWLLMVNGPSSQALVKLINFGLAASCADDSSLTQPCGTLHYLAPEVLRGRYGKPADNWTMGVLIFLSLYAAYPFDGESFKAVVQSILGSEPDWSDSAYALTDDARTILRQLLAKDPHRRLSARGALEHKFFSAISRHSGGSSSAARRSIAQQRRGSRQPAGATSFGGRNAGGVGPRHSQLITSEIVSSLSRGSGSIGTDGRSVLSMLNQEGGSLQQAFMSSRRTGSVSPDDASSIGSECMPGRPDHRRSGDHGATSIRSALSATPCTFDLE